MKRKLWIALIVSSLILSGCRSNKWDDVPLEESDIPFLIPPGTYVDVDGVEHTISTRRWVFNDGLTYKFIQWLKEDAEKINNKEEQ